MGQMQLLMHRQLQTAEG